MVLVVPPFALVALDQPTILSSRPLSRKLFVSRKKFALYERKVFAITKVFAIIASYLGERRVKRY
jgi:hypothetical protein